MSVVMVYRLSDNRLLVLHRRMVVPTVARAKPTSGISLDTGTSFTAMERQVEASP